MSKADDGVADRPGGAAPRGSRRHGYFFRPVRERDFDREPERDDFRGTLAPLSRASLRPIAIACLRLVTRRPEPLFNVPFFRRRIADSTFLDADLPYLAIQTSAFCLQTTCWMERPSRPGHQARVIREVLGNG
jgi:hypothetical protein